MGASAKHNLFWRIAAAGFFLCAQPGTAAAQEEESRQHKIEAAFLYNFFNYITWPGYASPQALEKPVVCLYGNDPVASYLDYAQHKMPAGRTLIIRKLAPEELPSGCHMLFSRTRINDGLAKNPETRHTLTVSDPDDSLDRSGMIELTRQDERLAMVINQSQLEKNGFKVSSRLLDLAERGR